MDEKQLTLIETVTEAAPRPDVSASGRIADALVRSAGQANRESRLRCLSLGGVMWKIAPRLCAAQYRRALLARGPAATKHET